jgi:hypothetical protein
MLNEETRIMTSSQKPLTLLNSRHSGVFAGAGRLAMTLLVLGQAALLSPAMAQSNDESTFSGHVRFGWRSTDVNGAQGKYKQHVNLDDGARLFGLHLEFEPDTDNVDLMQLDMNNFGGDPYEGFTLDVRKFGTYHLTVQRRESTYFYEDVLIDPQVAFYRLSNLGDLHHFDFERIQDNVSLDITLSQATSLRFFFDRFTKLGERTTVLDLSRDEFELDQRIDESMNGFGAEITHRWKNGSLLTLGETVREYKNATDTFLPGFSLGENPGGANLDFYFLDQPYDFTMYEHRVAYQVRPNDRFTIDLSGLILDLKQDAEFDERAQGLAFNGVPYSTEVVGDANFDRQTTLFDADLSFLLSERWAIVGALGYRDLDQDGDQIFGGSENLSSWQFETTSAELGLEVALPRDFTASFGALVESRDVSSVLNEEGTLITHDQTTDHTGGFARVSWTPSTAYSLVASLEQSSIDDPFTLVSPTDRTRLSLKGRGRFENGFFITGEVRSQQVENDQSTWDADQTSFQLDLGHQSDRLEVGVGYRLVDVERTTGPETRDGFAYFLGPIAFDSQADLFRGHLTWRATDRVRTGLDLRSYKNEGSFELERDDHQLWVEFDLSDAYLVHLGLRSIDYSETVLSFNDYDADIFELSLGYRWN